MQRKPSVLRKNIRVSRKIMRSSKIVFKRPMSKLSVHTLSVVGFASTTRQHQPRLVALLGIAFPNDQNRVSTRCRLLLFRTALHFASSTLVWCMERNFVRSPLQKCLAAYLCHRTIHAPRERVSCAFVHRDSKCIAQCARRHL